MDGSDTVTLTAAVANDKNSAGVSWTVSSGGGALSNQSTTSATYTAPAATSSSQSITITATSVATTSQTGTINITVPAAPAVTSTSTSLAGSVGTAYSVTLQASGGIAPYTWALGSGATLPTCLVLKSNGTITTASGTAPTAACAGSYTNLTFKATDSGTPKPLSVTSSAMTITITAPNLAFSPTLPQGNVGVAYAGSVAATGVVGASTYTIASGALPADLSLNASSGLIIGTPKASDVGTYTFSINVVDAYGDTATSGNLSIAIAAAPAIAFTGSVPTTGTYGVAFSGSAAASGGAGALAYSISAGALPADLSLSASTGAITGNPNKPADVGTFNFTVQAADAFGDSASQSYSLTISYPAMSVTTSTLPTGYVSGLYNGTGATLAAIGGTGVATNYSWQLTGGALPGGLSLSTAGVISGTLTSTDTAGTSNFTVKVTDTVANISGTANLSITVNAGVSITTSTLPTGYVGSAYTSTTLQASGGTGTGYQWIVTGGTNLPSGLTLSLAGVLSGTPTNPGTTSVTFQATDSMGNTASATLSITINAGVSVIAPLLASGYPGTAYTSSAFTASGGSGTGYAWSWTAASGSTLPNGLSLNPSTGIVSGTPVNAGTSSVISSVIVTATDSVGNKGSATVSITIEATIAVTSPATLPGVTVGVNPNYALTASGGSGTYTSWTVTSGTTNLAAIGLAVSANGVLTGANPTAGNATFTVTVTDSEGHTSAGATLSVTVSNTVTITTASINSLDVGQAASQTLAAAGGSGITADYSWSWAAASGSSIPPGLSLSTAGAITGSPTTAGTYNVAVTVKDTGITPNQTFTQNYTITINGALVLPTPNPASLPGGYTGVSYTGSVAASGGGGTYCYSVVSGLPSDGLSGPANNSLCGFVAPTFPVSGTPTSATTVTFTLKVTDTATGDSISKIYTIDITTPTAPSLPTPSTTVPGSATNGQSYTATIMATGGVGPTYSWTVNSTPVSGSLALGTSGLSSQFSVSNSGSSTLAITGNPTSTGSVTFTAQVKDNTTGFTSSTQSYTITVNSAGQQVSGQIFLNNSCGNNSNQPVFTVSINTNPVQTTTTDSSGNYSFASIPNGTYTITPSIPAAESSLFYPATLTNVTVNNSPVSGENFSAVVGYSVKGNVTYNAGGTPLSGQVYLYLQSNNCGGNGGPGTSITAATLSSGGAYTINGVPPGSYTLYAVMDANGVTSGTNYPGPQGQENANDPTGSNSGVSVSNADATGVDVTIANPTFNTPPSNPQIQVFPGAGGVGIFYNAPTVSDSNGNNEEAANKYVVQWSTSSAGATSGGAFTTVSGSHTFYAVGRNGATVWILNNTNLGANTFTSGTPYYFQVQAVNTLATTQSSGWQTYTGNGSTPVAVTPSTGTSFCSSSCTTVSGAVTIPAGVSIAAGAPLYVGIYQQSANSNGPSAIYAVELSSSLVGANNYSITIPSGSNYNLFGILDQNNDGQVDAGDVTDVNNSGNSSGITVSGSTMSGVNTTLPGTNSTANVQTQYYSCGTSCSGYSLNLQVNGANKLPVGVTLYSGPNFINPIDIGVCVSCGGGASYQYSASLPSGVTPNVGDQYNFTVTYSDGSVDQGSAGTINGQVTAFGSTGAVVGASDAASGLQTSGTNPDQPNFSWTDSTSAMGSGFSYSFYLNQNTNCSSNCTIWQIPGNNSNSNGFDSSITSLTWNVDPTGGNSLPTSSLSPSNQYNWTISVQDSNGNQAQSSANYTP